MGRDASLCRKRKLCHHISDPIWGFYYRLLLLGGTLLALRSSLLALSWFEAALASLFVCYLGKFHVFRNSLFFLCWWGGLFGVGRSVFLFLFLFFVQTHVWLRKYLRSLAIWSIASNGSCLLEALCPVLILRRVGSVWLLSMLVFRIVFKRLFLQHYWVDAFIR